MKERVIITCAITGSIHTPTMSPYLPITPEQIIEEAIKAAEAGASIVHIHVRDPVTGRPSSDINLFKKVLSGIKEKSDVVICPTTGGGLGMTVEERLRVVSELKPEIASFNMGSMNFALHHMLEKHREFKFEWEREYLEMSKDFIFRNTFGDMEKASQIFYANGTKPELECYDVGHIYNAAYLLSKGFLKPKPYLQFVMGILGGIGADIENLLHMKRIAEKLLGDFEWSVIGAGRMEIPLCTVALTLGGNVRVELEDNLYLGKGLLAKSNAELVQKIVRIARELGIEPATPQETRKILGLKGVENVNF
ncbi:MAG: 3-keto-5-aminohexanoate cleavage protein [Archaeoglobaceae archaeon]